MSLEKLRKERKIKADRLFDLQKLKFDPSEIIANNLVKNLRTEVEEMDKKIEKILRDRKARNGKVY